MLKKIICIGVILVMAFSFGAGCGPEWALESGFDDKWTNGNPPVFPFQCAYRSDKTEFDLDDVTLTFFYGNIRVTAGTSYTGEFNFIDREELIERTSHIEVYWSQSGEKTIIKTIPPEEFFSDGYVLAGTENGKFIYTHSEVLTIPREIFEDSVNKIALGIRQVHTEEYRILANKTFGFNEGVAVHYKITGNTVKLSAKAFK